MYQIRVLNAAARELSKLDKPIGRRIIQRTEWLDIYDRVKEQAAEWGMSFG